MSCRTLCPIITPKSMPHLHSPFRSSNWQPHKNVCYSHLLVICAEITSFFIAQSAEVFFNWGNSYYRQAEMKIQQNKSRDENSSTPRVSKSEVNTLLSNSARKYNHVLQINPENKQALQNWVKVLQFMDTVEKTFEIDISNNLLSQPEMNASKDGDDDDEESTASAESLSDTDPNIYSEVIFKKSNSKTGSGGLIMDEDEEDEPVPLLDSFLVLEVKLFLTTFQTLFFKRKLRSYLLK